MAKILGIQGETTAKEYLQSLKYKIIELNYKNKIGEIDIIAKDGDVLVFVEVKKPNNEGGMIEEANRMNKIRFPQRKFRRFNDKR